MPTDLPKKVYVADAEVIKVDPRIIMRAVLIENIFTLLATILVIVGLAFAMHSWHCMWGLVLMANMNKYPVVGVHDN